MVNSFVKLSQPKSWSITDHILMRKGLDDDRHHDS